MDECLLISLVEKHGNLYDKRRQDFKNTVKRENSWEKIANAMDETKEDCQRVWLNIRTRYGKELRRRNGLPPGSVYQVGEDTIATFQSLHFLEEHIKQRKISKNFKKRDSSNSPCPNTSTSSTFFPCPSTLTSSTSVSSWEAISDVPSPTFSTHEIKLESEDMSPESAPIVLQNTPTTFEKSKRNDNSLQDKLSESADALAVFIKEQSPADADGAFAQYVRLTLKKLPKTNQNKAKLEIMEILNKYDVE